MSPRLSGQRGSILVLTALISSVLLAMAALSIDAAFMFDKRNRLYAAADAAAKADALEVHRNTAVTSTALQNFAEAEAYNHGLAPAECGSTTIGLSAICVYHPPATGVFVGNVNYVEVIISEPTATFFGKILGTTFLTPGARAVAGTTNPQNCLILQDDLSIGNSALTMNGCGVGIGDDLYGTSPRAQIGGTPVPPVSVSGTCSGTCGSMGVLTTGTASPVDPLAGLPAPANPGGCINGSAPTLNPGCYLTISATSTTLNPGVYYVLGTWHIGSPTTVNNAMVYLTLGGNIHATNNKRLNITAPTSGPYAGIAIFQDPSDPNNFDTGNNFALNANGAIYMPGADVDFPNGLSILDTGCSLFLAHSLQIRNGNGGFSNNGCSGSYGGGAAFLSVSVAE